MSTRTNPQATPPTPLRTMHPLAGSLLLLAFASAVIGTFPSSVAAATPSTLEADRSAAQIQNSALDAPLFYELLIGELQLGAGELGTAYQVILDAARRSKDDQLFQHATQIALQGHAGDQALAAVKTWRQVIPDSLDALRYQVQLLVALNRSQEAVEPMQTLIRETPAPQRPSVIASVVAMMSRSDDKAATAALVEQVVQPYEDAPETRAVARVAVGRAWLAAGDTVRATQIALATHDLDPAAEAPAALALELPQTAQTAQTDRVIEEQLTARPDSNGVRLAYVRSLLSRQRYAEATAQLDILTRNSPDMAQAWLTLGALNLQLRKPEAATSALERYVAIVQANDDPAVVAASPPDGSSDPAPVGKEEALANGWMLLASAAEQRGDMAGAAAWLAKIDDPKRFLEVQTRRASLLAREGKISEARALIRQVPERSPADARAKLLAEAQVLRDAKRWADANSVLAQANQRFPDDTDLLYEQSMILEKLNKLDDMERLLRRVISIQPDHQHAYNALGYSLAERNTRLPEARNLIQKALELSPGEPSITDSLGWVEYKLGHRVEAVKLLRDAYRSQPDAEIAAHLGEVLWMDGQTDEARRVWREAKGRDAGNDVLRETLARLRVDL